MISTHKYAGQVALHEKCLAILNMKIEAIKRLDNAEGYLHDFLHSKDRYSIIRLTNRQSDLEDNIEWYKRVVSRVSAYYRAQKMKIVALMSETDEYDIKVRGWSVPYFLPRAEKEIYIRSMPIGANCQSGDEYGIAELTSHLMEPPIQLPESATNSYHKPCRVCGSLNSPSYEVSYTD